MRGEVWLCAFPNVFITITPAEWTFPRPYFLQPYINCVFAGAYLMALHMYYLIRCIWRFLANRMGHKFFIVLEYVMKIEYQGRGTPHAHIAAWCVSPQPLRYLKGNTKDRVLSAFVSFLKSVFHCEIDVQIGNGRLNYINGYVAKDHDAVDVGMGEYRQKSSTAPWLAAYRLLSKSSPSIPEVAIRMAQLTEFDRSYAHVLLFPPQPNEVIQLQGRMRNFSTRMYGIYLEEVRGVQAAGLAVEQSFLVWHRDKQFDAAKQSFVYRGGRHQQSEHKTFVVACRYWYELTDGYWGQMVLTQLPHCDTKCILPRQFKHLSCMMNFVGIIEYLLSWRWRGPELIAADGPIVFKLSALPFRVRDDGEPDVLQRGENDDNGPVFSNDRLAFDWLLDFATRDLQYRGMRDDRLATFVHKQEANFLLYRRVAACADAHEYEQLRQSWDTLNRPKYAHREWNEEQQRVLDWAKHGVSHDDETIRENQDQFVYIKGPPGCGKSALIVEMAIRAARDELSVLVCAPTGSNVYSLKSQLPEFPGVERIRVDTIQGVLNYKRPGKDGAVRWAPPSALRRIDFILCEEASQYEDREWNRLEAAIREQPHRPLTGIIADFAQLRPVVQGGSCEAFCNSIPCFALTTVYRSKDPEHLLFLNRIRTNQPSREELKEYFSSRHWKGRTLTDCVADGFRIARERDDVFTWLTCTNKGASAVCKAALELQGIADQDLLAGYPCDPQTKSDLRIIARPGLILRLSRNNDKYRGFVNGALCQVSESLAGNRVFTAKLLSSGNFVLVHPMEERGRRFLPCCYGYATTIRRAQGASLSCGAVFFDQRRHAAHRGYGYVAVSRFRTREGCHLYGQLRRTDFLPIGDPSEHEQVQRGADSASYSSNCSDDSGPREGVGINWGSASDSSAIGSERGLDYQWGDGHVDLECPSD